MKLLLKNKLYKVKVVDKFWKKFFSLSFEYKIPFFIYYKNTNIKHTYFLNNEIDMIGTNEDNKIIFIYKNVPKDRIIEVKNDKKNTNILVLPKNISKYFKLNESLTFINKDIV